MLPVKSSPKVTQSERRPLIFDPYPPNPSLVLSKMSSSAAAAAAAKSDVVMLVDSDDDQPTAAAAAASASSGADEDEAGEDESQLYFRAQCLFVGLQHYDGVAHIGEFVYLKREPHNPYDRNAIRVDNMSNVKFGHIKATQARVLAPIMDAMRSGSTPYGLTALDASLPQSPNFYNCKGSIEFYGTDLSRVPELEKILRSANIHMIDRHYDAPAPESSSKKKAAGGGGSGVGPVKSNTVAVKDWKSQKELDAMFEKQKELLDSIPTVSSPSQLTTKLLPHQVKGLSWMVHRETGEHEPPFWTETVENGRTVWLSEITNSSQANKPTRVAGGLLCDDMGMGKSLQTISLILSNPPPGHVYADGKDKDDEDDDDNDRKLSAVDADDADNYDDRSIPSEAAVKKLKVDQLRSIAASSDLSVDGMKKAALVNTVVDGLDDGSITLNNYYSIVLVAEPSGSTPAPSRQISSSSSTGGQCTTTLIVCPVSVMSNWIEQVSQHVKGGVLTIEMFQGTNRKRFLPLVKAGGVIDILLVSYQTLAADYTKFFGKDGKSSGLKRKSMDVASSIFDINFHRVVLDEAHTIRNGRAKTSLACQKLKATYRFGLTGTPLQNRPEDIRPLLSFLKCEPLGQDDVFRRAISQPIRNGEDVGLARLRATLCHFALRRTKDKEGVDLTDRTVQVCTVTFPEGSVHKRVHDTLFESAREAFAALLSAGDREALKEYMGILETLLRIRQACCSGVLIPKERLERAEQVLAELRKRKDGGGEPLTADEGKKLLEKLKGVFSDEAEDTECCICLEELSADAATILRTCSHIFCKECITKVAGMRAHNCPLCRIVFEKKDMVEMSVASKAATKTDEESSAGGKEKTSLGEISDEELSMSPKISALLSAIGEISDTSEKAVIFSQFTSFLDVIGKALDNAGHCYTRIDGKMNTKKRIKAMAEFNSNLDGSPRFILCSLLAAGTGINLTRGNHVFMTDLWWNRSVEDQAMDRVHRIGQERNVKVTKFVMENTIEEQIIKMQDAKYALGKGTLEKLSAGEMRKARVSALRDLFKIADGSPKEED